MFDELKEVKLFKKNHRFQECYNVKYLKEIKRLKSLQKAEDAFRTQTCIYNGAFLWKYLTAYNFCYKNSIIDARMVYI